MPKDDEGTALDILLVTAGSAVSPELARGLERADARFRVRTIANPDDLSSQNWSLSIDCIVGPDASVDEDEPRWLACLSEFDSKPPVVLLASPEHGDTPARTERAPTAVLDRRVAVEQIWVLASRIIAAVDPSRYLEETPHTSEFFDRITEVSSDYVLVTSAEGRVKYVSPSIEAMLGYTPKELREEDAFDFIHPDDLQVALQGFTSLLDRPGGSETVEYRIRHNDGSWRWAEVRGHNLLEDPVIAGFLINVRDISERKQYERELERYRTIVEASGDPMYTFDASGRLTSVNDATVDLTGFSEEELVGRPLAKIMSKPEVDRTEAVIRSLLSSRENRRTYETRIRAADGDRVAAEIHLALLPGDNEARGAVAVVRDISERIAHERRLEQERDRLDEFVRVVSHDLRNPLSVARGRLQLAKQEHSSEHLESVERMHLRLEELIENLLSLALQGERVGEFETVDLADLAVECWETIETDEAKLEVTDGSRILADPSRFKQLLTNLFQNACEHGAESVQITIGPIEDGFFIEDDGPGIPPEEREDIFSVGYSTAESGHGFGLGIVNRVVEAHGWDISVGPGETGGARFEITGVETAA